MRSLMLAALLLSPVALADSPFDGTWISKEDSSTGGGKPYKISLAKGMWESDASVPAIKVKADGTDQPVKGHAYYDTVAVKENGPGAADFTAKKGGKVAFTNGFQLSPDGKTLTVTWTDQTGTQPTNGENVFERTGAAPKGANPVSGTWKFVKMQNSSAAARTVTFKSTADGMSMSNPTGQSYTAKFDGKPVPIDGDPGGTKAALKKVNANTIVETDTREGKVVEVDHMTVSKDGKTIHVTWEAPQTHRKGAYVMEKQP